MSKCKVGALVKRIKSEADKKCFGSYVNNLGKKGLIIEVGSTNMPYKIKLDNGHEIWSYESRIIKIGLKRLRTSS